jgi:hypothetical protein
MEEILHVGSSRPQRIRAGFYGGEGYRTLGPCFECSSFGPLPLCLAIQNKEGPRALPFLEM